MQSKARLTLGATIKASRQELGWSQAELAERVAANGDWTFRQSDVSRLEQGRVRLPRRERLTHLSAVLRVPLGELLARSGWTGAEVAFSDLDSSVQDGPVSSLAIPERSEVEQLVDSSNLPSGAKSTFSSETRQLREAILEADAVIARSRAVLEQYEQTRVQYEEYRQSRASHRNAAQIGK